MAIGKQLLFFSTVGSGMSTFLLVLSFNLLGDGLRDALAHWQK
jgi:ABC-type dipeptide/oligopeptide/nickel transport system permease subunit